MTFILPSIVFCFCILCVSSYHIIEIKVFLKNKKKSIKFQYLTKAAPDPSKHVKLPLEIPDQTHQFHIQKYASDAPKVDSDEVAKLYINSLTNTKVIQQNFVQFTNRYFKMDSKAFSHIAYDITDKYKTKKIITYSQFVCEIFEQAERLENYCFDHGFMEYIFQRNLKSIQIDLSIQVITNCNEIIKKSIIDIKNHLKNPIINQIEMHNAKIVEIDNTMAYYSLRYRPYDPKKLTDILNGLADEMCKEIKAVKALMKPSDGPVSTILKIAKDAEQHLNNLKQNLDDIYKGSASTSNPSTPRSRASSMHEFPFDRK